MCLSAWAEKDSGMEGAVESQTVRQLPNNPPNQIVSKVADLENQLASQPEPVQLSVSFMLPALSFLPVATMWDCLQLFL